MAEILPALRAPDDQDYDWIFWMVATTLVPTIIHFIVALPAIGLGLWQGFRERMAALIARAEQDDDPIAVNWAARYAGLTYALSALIVSVVLYALIWALFLEGGMISPLIGAVLDIGDEVSLLVRKLAQ